jgi:hypothetical protein
MKLYGNTVTEKRNIPVYADGAMNNGNVEYRGIRKVGYKVVAFTYDVNPNFPDDKMLLSERTIKTKITA